MTDTISMAPVWFTDVVGSASMIVFSFLAVLYARRLTKAEPDNGLWTYLLWLSLALAGFAVSRSVGHIAKRMLVMMDMRDVWVALRPFSGAINSLAFVVVAAITLYFQRVHKINTAILNDKRALEEVSQEVMHLNRNLESLVRQRTKELTRSEQKYRRIFEGSMDTIFILDPEGRFLDINGAGVATLGCEERGQLVSETEFGRFFVSPEEYESLKHDLLSQGFVKDRECRLKTQKGHDLHILLSATIRRDTDGRPVSYEGIAKDITARVQMEKQLQRADKLASLGQISTGIAHEINNPLGVMLGYTQLLLRESPPGTQIHDDLRTIEKHALACETVVADLLKFSRSTRTQKVCIDVNECLREVISLLAHQFELDKIKLETRLETDLPDIIADADKLKQVFMNLFMNARQAIEGSGVIRVDSRVNPEDNVVRISITDSGCGISSELVDKIFDPFFTTKPVGEGTGLGLSVSYGIIQDHNGRIEVESFQGEGSTFTVVLPAEKCVPPMEPDPRA
jgi:two-component system, NtrC family, sensor kinase